MDNEELCDSLVKWVTTFDVGREQPTARELTDGVTMSLVLHEIAADFFNDAWVTKIKKDAANNWRLKVSNLKKILKGILEYYSEVLCHHISDFQMPDVNAIGENNNRGELGRLLQLILGCAINCTDKQEYIQRIMLMEENVQHVVMNAIQELMSKETATTANDSTAELELQLKRAMDDVHSLMEAKEEISRRCHELDLQVTSLQDDKMALVIENERLSDRLNQAENLEDPSSAAGKRYQQLQRDVEQLQDENFRVEAARDDVRIKCELLERELAELQQKNEELTELAEQTQSLRDELDIMQESANKLTKSEAIIETYKKRLEDLPDLRKQVKVLEEKNTNYMHAIMELEEELKRSNSVKSQLDLYKRQVQELQLKNSDETKRADKCQFEAKRLQEKMSFLVKEKEKLLSDRDKLKEEKEELSLLQFQSESLQGSLNSGADLSLQMMNLPTDVKEKLLRLEHENKMLKSSQNSDDEEDTQLIKVMLENSQSRNNELETEIRLNNQRILELDAQLEDARESTANASPIQETRTSELIQTINDHLQKIKDQESELQQRNLSLEEEKRKRGNIVGDNKKLEESLKRKEDEMRVMEEKYKKYLDKAKSVIKSLDPKRKGQNSETSTDINLLRNQLQEKDRLLDQLERDHEKAKLIREQEEKLMVSAWCNMSMQMHRKASEDRLANSGTGHSFLARQRQAHSRRAQSLATPALANSYLFVDDYHPTHFSLTPKQIEETKQKSLPFITTTT